jgi:hypothetical protein
VKSWLCIALWAPLSHGLAICGSVASLVSGLVDDPDPSQDNLASDTTITNMSIESQGMRFAGSVMGLSLLATRECVMNYFTCYGPAVISAEGLSGSLK